ncbi:hypothetical protein LBMAG42_01110 [Deltaproteobacteria bacterium]|nr:hypothetical protein LBMAG42_01110 [Deltaproteobacteria bacterium]
MVLLRSTLLTTLLLGCAPDPEPGCINGLDLNADGVCDRESADWTAAATVPEGSDRHNIYDLSEEDLAETTAIGLRQAGAWPVNISGVMLPAESFATLFEVDTQDPERESFQTLARNALGFGTLDEMARWLGLAAYPDDGSVPIPEGVGAGDPMGMGTIDTEWGPAFSVSCHACHTTELFGHVVVGLTNRRTRANEFFHLASQFFPIFPASMYQELTGATEAELVLFQRAQTNLPAVGGRVPMARGLDTSLGQVGLSLARREDDAWATRNPAWEADPRESLFDDYVADSKPAVWWTLRYKTRWLSDGSVVSGNPIFTNFLWNELGRGTDLHDLEGWLGENGAAVDALTVAVFNTPAPHWWEILPDYPIDVEAAKRGEVVFEANCSGCHGHYTKGWSEGLTDEAALGTVAVSYAATTQAVGVGTDPQRAAGMADFADALNDLVISQSAGTVVTVQEGYVPPPLDAIWARFPYLHNGSVPSLCALLSPAAERPASFVVGPPNDATTDFDAACVGLPETPPAAWLDDPDNVVDTTIPGLGNQGHEVIVDEADRADLIELLKTL